MTRRRKDGGPGGPGGTSGCGVDVLLLVVAVALLLAIGCKPTVHYADCDAARAAGATPLYSGEPGYRAALDRDHDGVACN